MTTIEFENEQTLGDKKLKKVELREPKLGDVRAVESIDNNIESTNQLFRRLADGSLKGITNEEIDELPWKEYKKINDAIEGFLL